MKNILFCLFKNLYFETVHLLFRTTQKCTTAHLKEDSEIATGDGIILEIVPWGNMRSNRVYDDLQ